VGPQALTRGPSRPRRTALRGDQFHVVPRGDQAEQPAVARHDRDGVGVAGEHRAGDPRDVVVTEHARLDPQAQQFVDRPVMCGEGCRRPLQGDVALVEDADRAVPLVEHDEVPSAGGAELAPGHEQRGVPADGHGKARHHVGRGRAAGGRLHGRRADGVVLESDQLGRRHCEVPSPGGACG